MDSKSTKKSIWDNKILWAVISLLASILLWGYVTNSQGDVIEQTFDGVKLEFKGQDALSQKEGFVIANVSNTTVSVRLRATRREIAKLSSGRLLASVDVSKFNFVGNYNQTVSIEFPMGSDSNSIDVLSTTPGSVSFRIDKSSSKTVEIKGQFKGTVADGYAASPMVFDPQTVTINGAEDDIKKVAYALVKVDRSNLDKTIQFDSAYILVDDQGNELSPGSITLDSPTVSVTLPITATKEVPLTVDLVEGGGATPANAVISCTPATITIAGDAETLSGINKISLGTVDLASFASTYEDTYNIVLGNGITNVTGITIANVTVHVIGMDTKKFNVTNLSIINAPSGSNAALVTQSIEVLLRGSSDVLAKIEPNNIRAVVDMSDIGQTEGVFQPSAKIYVDGYTNVGAIGEYKLYVKIN